MTKYIISPTIESNSLNRYHNANLPDPSLVEATNVSEEPSEDNRIIDNSVPTKKPFRLAARNFFLTFPKILDDPDLQVVLDSLVEHETKKNLKYACISREPHQDGSPHFHLLLSYTVKRQISNSKYFHFLFNKQGNYAGVRDLRNSLNYIQKFNHFKE